MTGLAIEPCDDDLVSVVIPARNEEAFIGRCLDAVLTQTYPNLEVLVVDGDSDDRTVAVVNAYAARDARVRLVANPARNIPAALNAGLAAASGLWFIRIDAHATVVPDYVARALRHLRTGRWGAVGGRVNAFGVSSTGKAIAAAMRSRFGIGNAIHHYGKRSVRTDHVPFPAYPLTLVRELGGWNEGITINEDFEFDWRLIERGKEVLYDPTMEIHYRCRQSLSDLFDQFRRYGRGKASVIRMHPRSMHARHAAAPALVAALAVAPALALRRPRLAVAAVAPYAAALTVASAITGKAVDDHRGRRMLPLVFSTMHVAWGIGFWQGMGDLVGEQVRGHRHRS